MVANLARAWSARFIEPIARFLGSLGLTPNAVTVLGFFLTVVVAGVLATGQLFLAGILLTFTLAFDAVDGTLARITARRRRSAPSSIRRSTAGRKSSCSSPLSGSCSKQMMISASCWQSLALVHVACW